MRQGIKKVLTSVSSIVIVISLSRITDTLCLLLSSECLQNLYDKVKEAITKTLRRNTNQNGSYIILPGQVWKPGGHVL